MASVQPSSKTPGYISSLTTFALPEAGSSLTQELKLEAVGLLLTLRNGIVPEVTICPLPTLASVFLHNSNNEY
jgi:hypothetical protein